MLTLNAAYDGWRSLDDPIRARMGRLTVWLEPRLRDVGRWLPPEPPPHTEPRLAPWPTARAFWTSDGLLTFSVALPEGGDRTPTRPGEWN